MKKKNNDTLFMIVFMIMCMINFLSGFAVSEVAHCYLLKEEAQDPFCGIWK